MNHARIVLAVTFSLALGACGAPDDATIEEVDGEVVAAGPTTTLQWTFNTSAQGWFGGVTDFSPGMEESIAFESGWSALPAPLSGGGFMLRGHNSSDDLWMFAARELGAAQGIVAGASYDVTMNVDLASNAPSGCVGIGGAPGESVFLKGRVVATRPRAVPGADYVAFNLDKGQQSNIGPQALSFGNLANGDDCNLPATYRLLHRTATAPRPVRATAAGKLWVYFGSDSGFEGTSRWFLDRVRVTLTRR